MSKIEELEQQLNGSKELVKFRDAVSRLTKNADFRTVIVDHFMTHDCARFVQESADPLMDAGNRADALAMAQAAGHLKRWLVNQVQFGDNAAGVIPDIEEALEALRAEGEE